MFLGFLGFSHDVFHHFSVVHNLFLGGERREERFCFQRFFHVAFHVLFLRCVWCCSYFFFCDVFAVLSFLFRKKGRKERENCFYNVFHDFSTKIQKVFPQVCTFVFGVCLQTGFTLSCSDVLFLFFENEFPTIVFDMFFQFVLVFPPCFVFLTCFSHSIVFLVFIFFKTY